MRTPHFCTLLSTLLISCLASEPEPHSQTQSPLVGDGAEVVVGDGDLWAVSLTRNSTNSFCTGTLISPSVVLTAAHCIDESEGDPTVTVYFGDDSRGTGTRIGVDKKTLHPNWTGSLANQHDIGMVLMNFPHPDLNLPMPMNTMPLEGRVGEMYRHVGFGVHETSPNRADGRKRRGTTQITGLRGDTVLSGDESLSVCFGDSGGPGIVTVDEVEYVAGIHSFTNSSVCNPPNGDTRVDLFVDDFILPWVQENDPVCQENGVCAFRGCTSDPDCRPCGANGECVEDCDLPDPDCPTSAPGQICQATTQCLEDATCVFWEADRSLQYCAADCTNDSDCPNDMACETRGIDNLCIFQSPPQGVVGDSCAEATDCGSYLCRDEVCTTPCDFSKGLLCPENFSCSSDNDVDFFCTADPIEDSGGCSSGRSSKNLLGIGILVFLLLGSARKRKNFLSRMRS